MMTTYTDEFERAVARMRPDVRHALLATIPPRNDVGLTFSDAMTIALFVPGVAEEWATQSGHSFVDWQAHSDTLLARFAEFVHDVMWLGLPIPIGAERNS